ncbi:MAG TPA: hypothetical protein VFW65_08685 [Pseudonocardiaceae bacterium]|nr:hypothetical protein [Pseudonocardiaceae bacterium]
MSDFPDLPHGPQGLGSGFFDECYNALVQQIRAETPLIAVHDGNQYRPDHELWQQWVDLATGDLTYWQDYALDGDVSMIPGQPDGPWWMLIGKGNDLYSSAYTDLDNAYHQMPSQWQGEAHNHAAGYLDATRKLVGGYCPSPGDLTTGLINEAARVLEGAYATVVAFKIDLYNLAKRASESLDELDKGGSGETVGVGLIIAGLALSGVGGAAQASDSITAAFGGGVVAALGGLVLNKGISDVKDAQPVGGRDPQEIMQTLAKATNTAQQHYSTAAGRVGASLSEIWHQIDNQMHHTMMRPVAAPTPNISPETSLNMSHFFPAG